MALFDIPTTYTIIVRGDDIPERCHLDIGGYLEREVPDDNVINFVKTHLGLSDIYAVRVGLRHRYWIMVEVVKES
jgi:hypothetical protein